MESRWNYWKVFQPQMRLGILILQFHKQRKRLSLLHIADITSKGVIKHVSIAQHLTMLSWLFVWAPSWLRPPPPGALLVQLSETRSFGLFSSRNSKLEQYRQLWQAPGLWAWARAHLICLKSALMLLLLMLHHWVLLVSIQAGPSHPQNPKQTLPYKWSWWHFLMVCHTVKRLHFPSTASFLVLWISAQIWTAAWRRLYLTLIVVWWGVVRCDPGASLSWQSQVLGTSLGDWEVHAPLHNISLH